VFLDVQIHGWPKGQPDSNAYAEILWPALRACDTKNVSWRSAFHAAKAPHASAAVTDERFLEETTRAGRHGVVDLSEGALFLLRRAKAMGAGASEGARPRAEVLSGEAHGLPWGSNTRPLSPIVVISPEGRR
jgi:hypothetical protein